MDLNVVAMLAWSEVMETGVMDVVVGQLPGSEDQLGVRVGEEGGEDEKSVQLCLLQPSQRQLRLGGLPAGQINSHWT